MWLTSPHAADKPSCSLQALVWLASPHAVCRPLWLTGPHAACLAEAAHAKTALETIGAIALPSWDEALAGTEVPQPDADDDILTARGW